VRRFVLLLLTVSCVAAGLTAQAATGRVLKVLPHFLDQQGRVALAPSLYERDAYQAILRDQPDKRSGMRFDVHYKARGKAAGPLRLRVELRGIARGELPQQLVLETSVDRTGWFGRWTGLRLAGDEYLSFGEVTAWRVTLTENGRVLGEQASFLW
jgi:hypothetical protein